MSASLDGKDALDVNTHSAITITQWGPDGVGYPNYAEFAYYQTQRPALGLPLPCTVTLYQQLNYLCANGTGTRVPCDYDELQMTIYSTGIAVTREGVTVSKTLVGN